MSRTFAQQIGDGYERPLAPLGVRGRWLGPCLNGRFHSANEPEAYELALEGYDAGCVHDRAGAGAATGACAQSAVGGVVSPGAGGDAASSTESDGCQNAVLESFRSRIASNDRAHAGCGVHLDLVMHDLSSRFTRDRIESAVAFLASEGIL